MTSTGEAAIVLRSAIVFVMAGWIVFVALVRHPRSVAIAVATLLAATTWLITEAISWEYRKSLREQIHLTHKQAAAERARTVRILAVELYTAYHTTAPEAQLGATDDRLAEIAHEEGLVWKPGAGDSNTEPLPLRVRRLRRALFEILPLWEEDAELLQQTAEWFIVQDPGVGEAFRVVLQGDARQLMQMRLDWLLDQAIPALHRRLLAIADDRENTARVVEVPVPAMVRIVPPVMPSGGTIRLDVTSMNTLREEADRLQIKLRAGLADNGIY